MGKVASTEEHRRWAHRQTLDLADYLGDRLIKDDQLTASFNSIIAAGGYDLHAIILGLKGWWGSSPDCQPQSRNTDDLELRNSIMQLVDKIFEPPFPTEGGGGKDSVRMPWHLDGAARRANRRGLHLRGHIRGRRSPRQALPGAACGGYRGVPLGLAG